MRIAYDFDWLHEEAVGDNGVSSDMLAKLERTHPEPVTELVENPHGWPIGWLNLQARTEEIPAVRDALTRIEGIDALITIGMGGSILGARALAATFGRQTSTNSFAANGKELILLDNLDEATLAETLQRVEGRSVALNPVSKSGNTLETVANFLTLAQHPALADAQVVVTTENEDGAVAAYARESGALALPVPQDVGGRFSVMSPVGLFPLAFLGYPIERLLAGASGALTRFAQNDYRTNPALSLAARLYLLTAEKGFGQLVLWSYTDALREWGRWWTQLFAESLGKRKTVNGREVSVGLTPLAALGPADQHSLLQLVLDGPADKVSGFIRLVEPHAEAPAFNAPPKGMERFGYLHHKRLREIAAAELAGTRESLRQQDRPSYILELPALGPEEMGELLLFFEMVVALAGIFYGVNPFDQPAVEESKRLARELLKAD